MKSKLLTVVSIALIAGPMTASAGLIGSFGTGSTGSVTGGSLTSNQPVFDVNYSTYFQGATTPASNWVWMEDPSGFGEMTFTFSFDLTGYDLLTASLSGLWGVDNVGSVSLNGILISSLQAERMSNFTSLTAFSNLTPWFLLQGANNLVFNVTNRGSIGAFRAAGEVSADLLQPPPAPPAEVPAPASLVLVGLGLAGLGFRKRPKK